MIEPKTQKYHDGTWIAWDENSFDGDPLDIGRGNDEAEAIEDLKERMERIYCKEVQK